MLLYECFSIFFLLLGIGVNAQYESKFSDLEDYGGSFDVYNDRTPASVMSQHHALPQYQTPEPQFQPTPQLIESIPPPSLTQSYGPSLPVAPAPIYGAQVVPVIEDYGHIDSYGPPIHQEIIPAYEEVGCAPHNPCAPPPPPPMCCAPPPPRCGCPPPVKAPCGGGCCLSHCEKKRQRRLLRRMRRMRRKQCHCARKAARRAAKQQCGRC